MFKFSSLIIVVSVLTGIIYSTHTSLEEKRAAVELLRQNVEQKIIIEYAARDIRAGTKVSHSDLRVEECPVSSLALSPFPECWKSHEGFVVRSLVKKGTPLSSYLKYPAATECVRKEWERQEIEAGFGAMDELSE
jgi:hypothetical protein